MDAHAHNRNGASAKRRVQPGDTVAVVHLVLHQRLLAAYGVYPHANPKVWCHTRFWDGDLPPSNYVRVHARFLGQCDERCNAAHTICDSDLPGGPGALALSLNILADRRVVMDRGAPYINPFNIAIARIFMPDGRQAHIPFFYLTLVNGARRATVAASTADSGCINAEQYSVTRERQPLRDIITAAVGEALSGANRCSAFTSCQPISVLSNLLLHNCSIDNTSEQDKAAKHHQALEKPGDVRGYDNSCALPSTSEVVVRSHTSPSTTAMPQCKVRLNRCCPVSFERLESVVDARHAVSGETFYICHYGNKCADGMHPYYDPGKLRSSIDDVSSQQLCLINPLAAIARDYDFMFRKMDGLVDSIEAAFYAAGGRLSQCLPVALPRNNDDVLRSLRHHFVDACFMLRHYMSEGASWVRATAAADIGQIGYWLDVLPLWDMTTPTWGAKLHEASERRQNRKVGTSTSTVKHLHNHCCEPYWHDVLREPLVRSVVVTARTVGLMADECCNIWLILPGGFAIKGLLAISVEDKLFMRQRYGGQ
uniref:Tegument protein n=1 Tax=Otarine gammaherpesvirus 4 TaxID=2801541 RepID=A0A889IWK3_9GAMA|nr:Tegument protein [Otarine gammaherpesvirus 4]